MCGREHILGVNAHMFLCFIIITMVSSHTVPVCCFWLRLWCFKTDGKCSSTYVGYHRLALGGRVDHAATTLAAIYACSAFVQLDFPYIAHNTICFSKPCGICHGNIRHAQSFQIPCHILSTANMAITVQNNMADQAYLTWQIQYN